MSRPYDRERYLNSDRRRLNQELKGQAINDGATWEQWEVDLMMECYDGTRDTTQLLAEELGRSFSAVEVQHSVVKNGRWTPPGTRYSPRTATKTVTTTVTTTYSYDNWPEEDRSEWYA